MQIQQITEDTYENMSIIEDLVDHIMATMPDVIPENSTYSYGYGGNGGNDWFKNVKDLKNIDELIKEIKDDTKIKRALQILMFNKIIFHNTEKYLKHNAYGDYSWGPINIYVSRIQQSTKPFVLNSGENTGPQNGNRNKLVRTIFHELRHAFQDADYSEYMRNKNRDLNKKTGETRPWGERQIEWDAKWSDTLYEFSPQDFNNAKDYVDAVMEEFKRWVGISLKVEQHYYRKTIAYYLNWIRKQLEKQWQKIIKTFDQYIESGSFTRQEVVDYVLEDLTWYTNNGTGIIPPAVKQYFKMKTIKYYEEKAKPRKTKNKLNQYIEKYKQEYGEILQNFLDANQRRIADINTYGAASGVVDKLMDKHPDFFYTKNKAMYEMSHEVNKHYYKQTVDYIKWLKEIQPK